MPDPVDHKRALRETGPVLEFVGPLQRAAIFVLSGVAGALFLYVLFGTYARHVELPGQVVPGVGHAAITVPQSGFVKRVWVTEGQLVRAGDPLFLIQDHAHTRQGPVREIELGAIAERRNLNLDGLRKALRLSDERVSRLDANERLAKAQLDDEMRRVQSRRDVQQMQQSEVARQVELADTGFVSQSALNAQRQRLAGAEADLAEAEAALGTLRRELNNIADSRLAELAARASAEAQIRKELAGLDVETNRANLAAERLVVAPESGRVAGIIIRPGEHVEERKTAMLLLPPSGGLVIAGYAAGRHVGLIRPGSAATVHYDAFPYQKYGVYRADTGTVAEIPTRSKDVDMPLPQSDDYFYKVEVQPKSDCVRAGGECLPLKVGMTARMRIETDRRTVLEWILDPLQSASAAAQR